jgi:hypothetical protein
MSQSLTFYVLKSSRAINHVNVELKTNVSEISSVSIATLMMETAEISETLISNSTLTWLIAPEEFSTVISSESFKYLISDIRFYRAESETFMEIIMTATRTTTIIIIIIIIIILFSLFSSSFKRLPTESGI